MAFLKINSGSNSGQMVEVSGERTVLGRHPNCEVVLDNVAVSRHHAQILENHGVFSLEDLRSRNKTFINGSPIDGRIQLHNGDQIKICDLSFTFYDQPSNDGSLSDVPQSVDLTALDFSDLSGSETSGPSETSSIISTLEVSSSTGLRLDVKPEVKLRAVLEISNAVGRVLDQQEVLHKVLDCLFSIFPQADEGFVLLKGPDDKKMSVEATKLRSEREDKTVRVSMTIVKQVMQTAQAVLSGDAMDDKQIPTSASLAEFQIRSMMCVPLIGKSGEPFGVLQLDSINLRQQFCEDDLEVLVSVASQVTLAVENAKLHSAVLKQRDMQRDMEFASQIQLGFLPNESPKLVGYEFSGYYEAAQDVGGDYFDYVTLSDHRVAVALGDVAGKGVA
ncbi:MAG: FHA domain-containing protein, partial [Planctomycetaceae bacterium]